MTAAEMMASLNVLPSEILNSITYDLPFEAQLQLYLTGDFAIRAKLEHGGITKVVIKGRKDIPPILQRFSLRSFSFSAPKLTLISKIAEVHMSQLLRWKDTLEEFSVELGNSFESSTEDCTSSSLADTLPRLRRLTISGCSFGVEAGEPFPLPPQLECFYDDAPVLLLVNVPVTLTSLQLPNNVMVNDELIAQLPPTLTNLNLRAATLVTSTGIALLPSGLLYLDISALPSATEDTKNLPRGLKSLVCWDGVGRSFVENLPREMTSLTLGKGGSLLEEDLAYLPPGLTYLHIKANRDFSDNAIFPPTLKVLRLPRNTSLTDACIPSLPPGLTTLELDHNDQITPEGVRALLSRPITTFRVASPDAARAFRQSQLGTSGKKRR